MCGWDTMPHEIAANIAMYTDHEDLQSFCDVVGTISIEEAVRSRCDPRPYLANLTPHTALLLSVMRQCNVVLVGSRASGLFYESASASDSDWDFCGCGGDVSIAMFTLALSRMGAVWEIPSSSGGVRDDSYPGDFTVIRGSIDDQSVQVLWVKQGVFSTIVGYHSSIVQCFVSGWCAVSMYHKVSSQNKMVSWLVNSTRSANELERVPNCLAKYQSRGFDLVKYSHEVVGVDSLRVPGLVLPFVPRRVSDEGCFVVDFREYNKYRSPVEELLHDAAMHEIMNASWAEHPDGSLETRPYGVTSVKWGMYRSMRMALPLYNLPFLPLDDLATGDRVVDKVKNTYSLVRGEPGVVPVVRVHSRLTGAEGRGYDVPWMPNPDGHGSTAGGRRDISPI